MPEGDPMMNAFEGEIKMVSQALRTGNSAEILGCDLARDAIAICQAQTKSLLTGKSLRL